MINNVIVGTYINPLILQKEQDGNFSGKFIKSN